jgi:hypothetical protein
VTVIKREEEEEEEEEKFLSIIRVTHPDKA